MFAADTLSGFGWHATSPCRVEVLEPFQIGVILFMLVYFSQLINFLPFVKSISLANECQRVFLSTNTLGLFFVGS